MIYRCSNDWQTEGHIYRIPERDQLQGDKPLIMIHHHHPIEPFLFGPEKKGIGGEGTDDLNSATLRFIDGGENDLFLFLA